jgi:arylsulfatase A-like enzyme
VCISRTLPTWEQINAMARPVTTRLNRKTTRRQAIIEAGTGLLSFGLLGMNFPAAASRPARRPNFLFILSDDHRWDALGHVAHPAARTPSLDRLAREGVLFGNAFCTTSLCSPSRASFLTGMYAHSHGVKNNMTPWNDAHVTFLEALHRAGYETGFVGKWHMPGDFPKLRGLDRFVTFTVDGGQGRYFDCPLIVDGKKVASRKPYITEELTDYALEFLDRERERPFCLYLSHKAVHLQFFPPKELDGLYDDVELELPREADSWVGLTDGNFYARPLADMYRDYLECLLGMDQQIGRVLDRLDELGLAENTVVIYAGDNGFFWGEHHFTDKRWPYEESIRIPLIVRDPQTIRDPGRRASQMVLNIDLAPTLLDMAGLRPPASMDGESFAPILKNADARGREAWLYEYFLDYPYAVPETRAIRTARYKYIEYEGTRGPELFDIVADPREMNNLYATPEGQALVPKLKKGLEALKQGRRL